jgi:hypothetical protein
MGYVIIRLAKYVAVYYQCIIMEDIFIMCVRYINISNLV